ncbi:MAG TPA: hypothetical protein VHI13_10505 [Candidatus Kapabacteria bacterium]|nr:hypothetical protein [Candidatus Kapabacteria bacterium]
MKTDRRRFFVMTMCAWGIPLAMLMLVAFSRVKAPTYVSSINQSQVGSIFGCIGSWLAQIQEPDFGGGNLQSSGEASGQTVSNQADPVAGTTKSFTSFSASGTDPALGGFTWSLDASRDAGATTITAFNSEQDFPATAHLELYLQATFDWHPGKVYRSRTPVAFSSSLVNTYPFVQEHLTLDSPVEFEDSETGELAFTLQSATATLSTNPDH